MEETGAASVARATDDAVLGGVSGSRGSRTRPGTGPASLARWCDKPIVTWHPEGEWDPPGVEPGLPARDAGVVPLDHEPDCESGHAGDSNPDDRLMEPASFRIRRAARCDRGESGPRGRVVVATVVRPAPDWGVCRFDERHREEGHDVHARRQEDRFRWSGRPGRFDEARRSSGYGPWALSFLGETIGGRVISAGFEPATSTMSRWRELQASPRDPFEKSTLQGSRTPLDRMRADLPHPLHRRASCFVA